MLIHPNNFTIMENEFQPQSGMAFETLRGEYGLFIDCGKNGLGMLFYPNGDGQLGYGIFQSRHLTDDGCHVKIKRIARGATGINMVWCMTSRQSLTGIFNTDNIVWERPSSNTVDMGDGWTATIENGEVQFTKKYPASKKSSFPIAKFKEIVEKAEKLEK